MFFVIHLDMMCGSSQTWMIQSQDSLIVLRIILASITGYIAFCIYKNPKLIDDAQKLVVDAIRDLYHYGEDKFVNNNSTAVRLKNKNKYISLDDLDNL